MIKVNVLNEIEQETLEWFCSLPDEESSDVFDSMSQGEQNVILSLVMALGQQVSAKYDAMYHEGNRTMH